MGGNYTIDGDAHMPDRNGDDPALCRHGTLESEGWCAQCQALGDNEYEKEAASRIGEISDGYHTFNELYEHRHALFIALCRVINRAQYHKPAWRSRLHHDGTMFDGWFVLGLDAQDEQITYHLPMRLWDATAFADTLNRVPEWDGHTPADVIERLRSL